MPKVPLPLPPRERVCGTPSLDGRGKGEGDDLLKFHTAPLVS